MALGLNGHLSRLTTLNIHDYLCRGHDFTGVGLLLGIAAAHMGSMDVATTRVLSIHVGALLPPTSTELDVSHVMQVGWFFGCAFTRSRMLTHMSDPKINDLLML